jgi:hypothetical protein
MVTVGICLVGSNGETGIDEEDTAVGPGGEETPVLWGWSEVWVILCEGFEDVFEGRWSGGRSADGETETMGLIEVMIRVLADNYSFDSIEGCMS